MVGIGLASDWLNSYGLKDFLEEHGELCAGGHTRVCIHGAPRRHIGDSVKGRLQSKIQVSMLPSVKYEYCLIIFSLDRRNFHYFS